jgi:hypothetical protein
MNDADDPEPVGTGWAVDRLDPDRVIALVVLLYLNWSLTLVTIDPLLGGMAIAFGLRPLFRERAITGEYRPPRRIARRRPHRQGLHRREAKSWSTPRARTAARNVAAADRRVGDHRFSSVVIGTTGRR